MKKIGFLGLNLHEGGAEKFMVKLANNLIMEVLDNYIIVNQYIKGKGFECKGRIIDLKINYNNFIEKWYKAGLLIKKIKNIKRELSLSSCISFSQGMNFLNIITKHNEKTIISSRTYESFLVKKRSLIERKLYKILIKNLYKKADLIVAVSEGVRHDLITNFNISEDHIIVVYNFYDVKDIEIKSCQELPSYESIFLNQVILNIARLSKEKGQGRLVYLFATLKRRKNDVKLVIIGEGPERDNLISLARGLGLHVYSEYEDPDLLKIGPEYDVYFLSFKANPYKFIRRASLFVLTSLYEGFPNVIVESLICGTPVISTDCPSGPREILAPGTDIFKVSMYPEFEKYGVLMPPINIRFDVEEWVEVIQYMIEKKPYPPEILKERAYDFSKEKILPKWKEIIM